MAGLDYELGVYEFRIQNKKRRTSSNYDREFDSLLPTLNSFDYYTEPCLSDLIASENADPGYCSRVPDFTVGRFGYGHVRFFGETDVRGLDLDRVVRFFRHGIVVYEDESVKPEVGEGLNKPAEVGLVLQLRRLDVDELVVAEKLQMSMERQGACFISYDRESGVWKFSVPHFSKFGLSDDDEDDIVMGEAVEDEDEADDVNDDGIDDMNGDGSVEVDPSGPELYHSLPAHLRLDPAKMKEMRMLMFPGEEEDEEEELLEDNNVSSNQRLMSRGRENIRSPLLNFGQRMSHKSIVAPSRKTPVPLLEYNPVNADMDYPGTILMAQQNKGLPLRKIKQEGFKLDLKQETPVTGTHSRNIVDAGLFMGRSFRVGWGPNGVLIHSGAPVGSSNSQRVLSSVVHVEKVAMDNIVRDENNKSKEELVEFAFDSPLNLHRALNHEIREVREGSVKLKLQKAVSNCIVLSEICQNYIDVIERQLEVSGLSPSARLVLTHQVMIWELIRVLYSEKRENIGQSESLEADNEEDMMQDSKEDSHGVDQDALPLIRRAAFSYWLRESVYHRVQEDISSLDESSYLEHMFLLLTGRQLDAAVEMAAAKGDVRLACLLSQAGGSTVNRRDIARQIDLWKHNGLDFKFIENERIRLYELLSGNILDALHEIKIDWKRFLGLLMWYRLPPDTPLPIIFQTYQKLLDDGKAPFPLPIYIDEGRVDQPSSSSGNHFDLSYYLMLLHANGKGEFLHLKAMLSAFASTNDPIDYHMIWHQRAVLEAAGIFTSNDLHVLDMGLVSQLLCIGHCHWAIYVVLHIPYRDDYPRLHATVIREILFQYCETWSSDESQRQFIEDLDIPSEWLHEAMAVYLNYHGDLPEALEHYIKCANWQKAHSIFITSVAHTLFLSGNHAEIWRLATAMEDHKSEIENWDLGAGIYISFYLLRSSLQGDDHALTELDSLEGKGSACRDFFSSLNGSLATLGDRLPLDTRVAYSKMAEEISELLLSDISEGSMREVQLSCFDSVFSAPIPEDRRSDHLQDSVSLFSCHLSEMAA